VLVTVGREIDPAELGPQSGHVHVERFLPQADVLPRCELVVFHGGSGTLTGALAHGLPMVILAMGADQPANAMRCEALGLGISLEPVLVTPNEVRDAAASVLADQAYGRAAQQWQRDIAAQPATRYRSSAPFLAESSATSRSMSKISSAPGTVSGNRASPVASHLDRKWAAAQDVCP